MKLWNVTKPCAGERLAQQRQALVRRPDPFGLAHVGSRLADFPGRIVLNNRLQESL